MEITYVGSSTGYAGVEIYSQELKRELEKKDIEVNQVEPATKLKPHFLNHLLMNSRELGSEGVVHVTNQDLMSGFFMKKGKMVVTVHDIFPYLGYSGPIYSQISRFYVRNIERKADKIIAISEFTRDQLIENTDITDERIEVIYQGVDLETFCPKEGSPFEFDYFLHVGSEIDRKNIEGLIEIFSDIKEEKDVKLVRVGNQKEETKNLIESKDLEDDVIYVDNITTEKLVKIYSGAEKLLFPSEAEGFGRPMIESLACGTPVVAFDRSPMNEVLPEEMLVDWNDQERFVEKALESSDTDCRSIADNYSWERTAEETVEVYRQLGK
ncbi:MAG: glycosyltransferase family 4 protein [Nanohaloarchaea archaeon]|nr:glycosyltransferase family 4 protein [Candidatus Nanohaloarchaea archaeon]